MKRRPLVFGLVLIAACASGEPQPIRIGEDRCDRCLMGIAEERFAAELITRTGKVYTFDSIECLAGFVLTEPEAERAKSVWVTDYEGPPRLLDATRAFYIRSDSIRSPMGAGFAAYANRATRDAALRMTGAGEALDWDGVLRTVESLWPGGSPHGSASSNGGATDRRHPLPEEGDTAADESGATSTFSITAAIANAQPGSRIVVPPGTYTEPTLVIDRPLDLVAGGDVVLDGQGERGLVLIRSDDVSIRGFTLRNTGTTFVDDRAAIRVENARRCRIEENRIEDGFFAIYLASAADCEVRRNTLTASQVRETASGNGVHVWYSRDVTIADNDIRGYRDGIYFEFVKSSRVSGNNAENNLRYGLHFMFSDSCTYEDNVFRANGAGVAVMYARAVEMTGNSFVDNWGTAAFGLLLKDIRDSRIAGNTFDRNSVALYAEASSRLEVHGNVFTRNGWAVKLLANSENSRFTANDFEGNTFDVATNSRRAYSTFEGNWWAEYRGYDLDRDGTGDVAHRPVRLFSLIVERNEPSLILLRSFLVGLLDAAESLIPALTPETLQDERPLMERAVRLGLRGRRATDGGRRTADDMGRESRADLGRARGGREAHRRRAGDERRRNAVNRTIRGGWTMIRMQGIRKRFGALEVLRGVDLDMAKGRVTAIIGPNGSGKTTLIRMLLGLVKPDAGTIRWGAELLNGDCRYRERIGYMPQIVRFPENLSGRELLDMVADLRSRPPTDDELIRVLDLERDLDKPFRTLSGGTRQKVNAAIAFRFAPDLLVLDEPTAGLDPVSARALKDKVRRERARGRTILITSHIMSELESLADDVAFLLDGTVRFHGSQAEAKRSTGETELEGAVARMIQAGGAG